MNVLIMGDKDLLEAGAVVKRRIVTVADFSGLGEHNRCRFQVCE